MSDKMYRVLHVKGNTHYVGGYSPLGNLIVYGGGIAAIVSMLTGIALIVKCIIS